jgi:uncharacterized membrane protein
MNYLGHFLLVGGVFAVIDALWIGIVANKFYKSQMGELLAAKPNFVPAVIFYLIYVAAMLVFVLEPALDRSSLGYAAGYGAMLGFTAYATYDLTNAATLKKWPASVTVVDMGWGTIVTAAVSTIVFLILN